MTQAEKLEALVRKARLMPDVPNMRGGFDRYESVKSANAIKDYCEHLIVEGLTSVFLFSPVVARALFGKELVCGRDGSTEIDQEEAKDTPWRVSCPYENGDYSFAKEAFEYHLQQAVISDDPIDYMHKAVFGE